MPSWWKTYRSLFFLKISYVFVVACFWSFISSIRINELGAECHKNGRKVIQCWGQMVHCWSQSFLWIWWEWDRNRMTLALSCKSIIFFVRQELELFLLSIFSELCNKMFQLLCLWQMKPLDLSARWTDSVKGTERIWILTLQCCLSQVFMCACRSCRRAQWM